MVIRDCDFCGSHGCQFCICPEEILQMRHDALATLSGGSEDVIDLTADRAAQAAVYRPGDPRKPKKPPREVDADCAFCHKRSVVDFEDGWGYLCRECGKEQPIEELECVYCELKSAIKRIDGCKCYLCDREQPTESNVVPIR